MKARQLAVWLISAWLIGSGAGVLFAGQGSARKMIEYEVLSVDPGSWIVTAREAGTENTIKFRLSPEVFVGQTFAAEFSQAKIGQRLPVRGLKNARLRSVVMEQVERRREMRTAPLQADSEPLPNPEPALPWLIEEVDGQQWLVTSRNQVTGEVAQIRIHPDSFVGYRFKASADSIRHGEGFTLFTPNEVPMQNCCTLMRIEARKDK